MPALTQFVERAASINRHGTATICGDRRRTWSEVLDRVRRAAGMLRELGLAPGERVAILAPNSDTYLEYLFAVAWAGGVIVPINTRLAPAEMLGCLEDCGAAMLAVAEPFVEVVGGIRERLPQLRQFIYLGQGRVPEACVCHEERIASQRPVENAGRADDDLYALFYTSGTSGTAKGVMINHQGMFVNVLQWIAAVRVTGQDRFLIVPPMFHAAGAENSLALAALAATACIPPAFDALESLRLIENEQLTKLPLVVPMLDRLVRHPQIGRFDLSSIDKITYGASPIHADLLKRAMAAFPGASFFQIFGQTEGGPAVTCLAPEYHVSAGPYAGKLQSAGTPLIGVDVAILDEHGRRLADGETGEICIRGAGVAPGYWMQPELNETAYVDGWLRSGDAGHLDEDGFLYISDRVKDMIISGGENVYPAEVERVLLGHDAIEECAVIGIPSAQWGEQVHAIVRCKAGKTASAGELIARCREHLAGYKTPRRVEFREQPLPLGATGKILKRELRSPYWEGGD